jgi:hypothetical protein
MKRAKLLTIAANIELKLKYGSKKRILSRSNDAINQNANSKWTTSFLLPFTRKHNQNSKLYNMYKNVGL